MKQLLCIFIIATTGCRKDTKLVDRYPQLIGTWSNNLDVTISFKDNGTIVVREGFERGFKFKTTGIEESSLDDGTQHIRVKGKSDYGGDIEMTLLSEPSQLRVWVPVSDTLWKI